MSSSNELLDKVVDLINKAKVEAKEQKMYLLVQVREGDMQQTNFVGGYFINPIRRFQYQPSSVRVRVLCSTTTVPVKTAGSVAGTRYSSTKMLCMNQT